MSRSKKIRTKSTDRGEPRHIRRLQQIRQQVAAEAARIIATEGQHNYHAAKKKAAERIGVSERLALPSNVEVKDALGRYQALYGGSAHFDNLERLRRVACKAMQLLHRFDPRLVGSVLDGTASEHSRISLHVFTESEENVVLFFLDRATGFHQEQRQIRWFDNGHRIMPLVVSELEGIEIELAVFERVHLRQAPPSPIDGKPQHRAALAEVESLLGRAVAARPAQEPAGGR